MKRVASSDLGDNSFISESHNYHDTETGLAHCNDLKISKGDIASLRRVLLDSLGQARGPAGT